MRRTIAPTAGLGATLRMGDGILAHTPWGEIAYALAGPAGYERVRRSDEEGTAPGAETLAELFGGEPTLILLDELAVYLRKVWQAQGARHQLTAFLTFLFTAVESAPNAALVYTLAIGRDGPRQGCLQRGAVRGRRDGGGGQRFRPQSDAAEPHRGRRNRASAAAPLVRAHRRRNKMGVVDAYQGLWREHRESLAEEARWPETAQALANSYPFHPDVLDTLRVKTSTLSDRQPAPPRGANKKMQTPPGIQLQTGQVAALDLVSHNTHRRTTLFELSQGAALSTTKG